MNIVDHLFHKVALNFIIIFVSDVLFLKGSDLPEVDKDQEGTIDLCPNHSV